MAAIWKALGKPELEKCIGIDNLERLENLLPAFSEKNFSRDQIYGIDGLSKIFDSFCGLQYLSKKEFRENLFYRLPPENMNAALTSVGINHNSLDSFEKKIEALNKAWRKPEKIKLISQALGFSADLYTVKIKQQENFFDIEVPTSPYKPLKDYQFSVFSEAGDRLTYDLSRFIIQMPTGSGKTRTAMEIITHYMKTTKDIECSILWLAHSEELCEQAFSAFVETWAHVSTKPLRAIKFWGKIGDALYKPGANSFIVSSFQKLYSQLKKQSPLVNHMKNNISLIIIDEAHKVLAPTYEEVTRAFMGENTKVIGLTATPGRSAINEKDNAKLAKFFFNEIINISAPDKESDIDFLRKKRVLSHVEYDPLITGIKYDLTAGEKRNLAKFFDFPPAFINRLGKDDIRNAEIVKRIQHETQSNKRILFFACSVEHSKFISALLGCIDINSLHVDGNTPKIQRSESIQKFRNGEISVLCNYGILSTGFDAPQTDVVFISRPTASIVLYSQMIGRGLRGPEIGGTETCKIIDVIDNILGFSNENKVYDYFKDYYGN